LIVTVIFFMTRVPSAHAARVSLPPLIISPGSGPPGTLVGVVGFGFDPTDSSCVIYSYPSGLISSPTVSCGGTVASASFTVASGARGVYTVTIMGNTGDSASGSFIATPPTRICVIRLGVEQTGGTVLWLPGYGYPDTPISQCQNMTEVLGQDVLGRTIVLHQFMQNMTYYEIVTRYT